MESVNCIIARSALFAATDPQVPEFCSALRADNWPVCPYFSGECRPANASAEAHNMDTALKIWDKTLELIGVPSDIVEKLIECEQVPSENGHSNVTEVDCW
ncbi:hypothetical protein SUGI_0648410 [Cryptomeria japonica]|nr:hypothetical protein SUGI_0648410 [Cryptomeria japonica]